MRLKYYITDTDAEAEAVTDHGHGQMDARPY